MDYNEYVNIIFPLLSLLDELSNLINICEDNYAYIIDAYYDACEENRVIALVMLYDYIQQIKKNNSKVSEVRKYV